MKKILVAVLVTLFYTNTQAQGFEERVTNASQVRLTVTNQGTFGNAFRGYRDGTGSASCEYPAGSGIEHLFESGIWVSGVTGAGELVSSAAIDNPQGYRPGQPGFEFTFENIAFSEQSSLTESPFYTPSAVSHQDFVAVYTDKNIVIPGTNIPIANHSQPLFVEVTQATYNWNYTFSDFFVILNFKLKNIGDQTINDPYFGFYANTVVRNIKVTPAGAGGAAFYSQGGNGFIDSLSMSYCYDATGDVGFTDSYIGQRFLGADDKYGFYHPSLDSTFNLITNQWEPNVNFKSHYSAWTFNSPVDNYFPTNDQARFQRMRDGFNHMPCWTDPDAGCVGNATFPDRLNQPGNRSDLVSVGPFRPLEPGDVVEIAYAIIIGKKAEDGNPNTANTPEQQANLIANSEWAQTAFNGEDVNFNGVLDPGEDSDGDGKISRYILPEPPATPQSRVETSDNRIDIYWTSNAEESIDPISNEKDFEGYRVYLSKFGFDVVGSSQLELVPIAEYDIPGNQIFNDIGFDKIRLDNPITFEGGDRIYEYRYSIENVLSGWQYAVAVTSFDRGNEANNLESLETSPFVNTYRVFPGTNPNADIKENEPFVYPNPYYSGAAWEGISNFQEESRKIVFANLPERCIIRVFSPAGDLIDEINHDAQYDGTDTRWFQTFAAENAERNVFSGGEHAWNLLSKESQIISRGIYLFTVDDLDSGKKHKGKFVIIK